MPPPRSANKWNITNHFISPLLFFALGLMVASTMNGSAQHESVTAAPGTQTRLVELMGEINDNEMTISDLKRQLTEQESKCDKLDHELSRTQDELVKAQQAQSAASPVEENWDKEVLEEEKYSKSIAGAQGKNVKWNKVGNWQMTDIEPLSFVKKFDVGCVHLKKYIHFVLFVFLFIFHFSINQYDIMSLGHIIDYRPRPLNGVVGSSCCQVILEEKKVLKMLGVLLIISRTSAPNSTYVLLYLLFTTCNYITLILFLFFN